MISIVIKTHSDDLKGIISVGVATDMTVSGKNNCVQCAHLKVWLMKLEVFDEFHTYVL